jgi:DNA-binding NarL/FixJ family response regulator
MKIIVADDHAMFREGVRYILQQLASDVVILEAETYDGAVELLTNNTDSDVALIDLKMPGRDVLQGLSALLAIANTVPIVVVSGSEDPREIHQVINAGAMGFIPKREHASVFLMALRLVMGGGIYIPPMLAMVPDIQRERAELTARQCEVLRCIRSGNSNKEIATALGLSEATVKTHITAILKSLNVTNRSQAVQAAERLGRYL